MPRSRFDKSHHSFNATRVFAGRHDERQIFDDAWRALSESSLSAVVFYGIAGIGKTRLGQALHFRLQAAQRRHDAVGKLDFRIAELAYPPDALASLARQLPYACPTFEFAALRRWALLGQPLTDFRKSFLLRPDSPTTGVLDYFRQAGSALAEDGGLIPGLPLIIALGRSGSKQLQQWTNENKAVLRDITSLDAFDLQERLPFYLGLDIARAAKRKHRTILVFDAIERLGHGDGWIRDLLAPAQGCLAMLSSRHRLRWQEGDSSWQDHLRQHRLGRLSDLDVEEYLRSVPIVQRDIRERIVGVCRGYPLAMDHCVSIYEQCRREGHLPSLEEFEHDHDELVARLVDHLPEVERDLVTTLSISGPVTNSLYDSLVDEFVDRAATPSFRSFKRRAYLEKTADESLEIDAPLATFLKQLSSLKLRRKVLRHVQAFYDYTLESSIDPEDWSRALRQYFSQYDEPEVFDAPRAVRVARWLIDRGRYHEVEAAVSRREPERPAARSAWNLLMGIIARRIGRLATARQHFRKVDPTLLGSCSEYARFHVANCLRLSGAYSSAFRRYRRLVSRPSGSDARLTREATRQLADLHMLRGEFADAKELLASLLKRRMEDLERAQVLRIQGHVYRWNLQFNDAIRRYERARELAIEAGALGLRLQLATNLVEANALAGLPQSTEIWEECVSGNRDSGTLLEYGKALTAEALALVMDGTPDAEVIEKLRHADEVQTSVGYKSGRVFVAYVRMWLASRSGNRRAVASALRGMSSRIATVGVYRFLLSLPWEASLPSGTEAPTPDWLSPRLVNERFDEVLRLVRDARPSNE